MILYKELIMQDEEYLFDKQTLIVGYDDHSRFLGILVTYPGEAFTKAELMDYFHDLAEYIVVADISFPNGEMDLKAYDKDAILEILRETVERAAENKLTDSEITRYIPKYLH